MDNNVIKVLEEITYQLIFFTYDENITFDFINNTGMFVLLIWNLEFNLNVYGNYNENYAIKL